MNVLRLTESGPAIECTLTSEQARALNRAGIVKVRPGEPAGRCSVGAGQFVGAARVAGLELRIAPKLPIDRLLFLVGYAGSGRHWRDDEVRVDQAPELVPVLAEALWRQGERALRQGVLQGYRTVDQSAPVLRGRLREADQMRRHPGQPWPLEVRHDEFTVDIAENQILRTAVERMVRVPRVSGLARQRLRHLAAQLSGARPLPRGSPVPQWHPNRLNARYRPALRLAELVLRSTSIELGAGGVAITGLLLDMWRVFEDFLTTALREALEPSHGGRVRAQLTHPLDLAGRVTLVPDVVWLRGHRAAAVVDAKYKAESPAGYPHADLYQLLAYCTALGLPRGFLVYAAGYGDQPVRHTVRNAGVELVCESLDLSAPPDDLLAQVGRLATRLASAEARTSE